MLHPEPNAIRTAMDRLEACVDEHDGPILDMGAPEIYREIQCETCETVACHGGWCYLAFDENSYWANNGTLKRNGHPISFKDGANGLAHLLGFNDMHELKAWAAENREQWGTPYGAEMFKSHRAFNGPQPATIHTIIAHWREVAHRIEAIQ